MRKICSETGLVVSLYYVLIYDDGDKVREVNVLMMRGMIVDDVMTRDRVRSNIGGRIMILNKIQNA